MSVGADLTGGGGAVEQDAVITRVTTPAQKAAFAAAICGKPHFGAVMGTDLALWADNPGAPVQLYLAYGAALTVGGRRAQLCGDLPDRDAWQQLVDFLRFCGVERLLCAKPCLPHCQPGERLNLYELPMGARLPAPPLPPLVADGTLVLSTTPPMGAVAALLFPGTGQGAQADRDYFYSVACTAINHGIGCCRALLRGGVPVTTVGCYEKAGGQAYMAAGVTAQELRGQGLGGWLIASLANELAAAGNRVAFLCADNRCHFYERLGFTHSGALYNTEFCTDAPKTTQDGE